MKPKSRKEKDSAESAVTPKRRRPQARAAKVASATHAPPPLPLAGNDNAPLARPPLLESYRPAPPLRADKAPEPPLWLELWQPLERRLARRRRTLAARGRELSFAAQRKLRRGRAGARFVIESQLRALRHWLVRAARAIGRWALRQLDDAWNAGAGAIVPVVHRLTSIERAVVAGALTALAMAIVAVAWVVVYSQAPAVTQPKIAAPVAVPPAPPKQFTERIAAPPLKIVTPDETATPGQTAVSPPTESQAVPAPAKPKTVQSRRKQATARRHRYSRARAAGSR